MVVSFGYDMKKLELDKYEALPGPVANNTPDSTMRVEDLPELDLPPTMATPPTHECCLIILNPMLWVATNQG